MNCFAMMRHHCVIFPLRHPGLSPFTMNKRAEEKLASRKTKVPNWYLDLSLLNKYWGSDRVYHHTAPVNMNFAIREGLR